MLLSRLAPCFVALFAALCLCACGKDYDSTLDKVLATGELVVGTEPEFKPFESRDADGNFVGFDMDMARALAKDLGVKVRIEAMSFESLPVALGNGTIDIIISGMTATAKRAKSRSFSNPYFHTELVLLVGKDSGINKPADANGKRIVAKLGTTGETQAGKLFPEAKLTKLETEGACAMEVISGRADAFLYDKLSILRHHRQHPDATRVLLEPLSQEPYSMAVRHNDTKFVARLNEFLAAFTKDGRKAALMKRHMPALAATKGG